MMIYLEQCPRCNMRGSMVISIDSRRMTPTGRLGEGVHQRCTHCDWPKEPRGS